MQHLRALLSLAFLVLLLSGTARARCAPAPEVYLTVEEALALAFPKAEVERTRAFLTEEEEKQVGKLAKRSYEGRTIVPYVASRDGKVVGTAYFDTHKVRSKRETLMVVVDPTGKVRRIEVLAFAEPKEYLPVSRWYGQFPGKALDDELELKRGIKGVTGATLTARATVDAVRRILALHQILDQRAKRP